MYLDRELVYARLLAGEQARCELSANRWACDHGPASLSLSSYLQLVQVTAAAAYKSPRSARAPASVGRRALRGGGSRPLAPASHLSESGLVLCHARKLRDSSPPVPPRTSTPRWPTTLVLPPLDHAADLAPARSSRPRAPSTVHRDQLQGNQRPCRGASQSRAVVLRESLRFSSSSTPRGRGEGADPVAPSSQCSTPAALCH